MLDLKLLRDEKTLSVLKKSQMARGADPEILQKCIDLDIEWRKLQFELNNLRKTLNAKSKEYANKKSENTGSELMESLLQCKNTVTEFELLVSNVKTELTKLYSSVGNIVHDTVPVSMDESNNLIVSTFGDALRRNELHHHEVLQKIDGYSQMQGVHVAGHRGYFLKGVGVLLNQAIINYGIYFLTQRGYTPIQPPYFMKKDIMAATAQLEEFDEALYKISGNNEEMYLIATSEQPISAYHSNEVIQINQLPIKYAGISTCFRKEAGAHGKDTRGIFRIHQFEKVEQFIICKPEESWKYHEEMIKIAEEFYQSLGLSYRVVSIVSGALNNAAAKKLDLEAWFPVQGCYRELVSASNCTDYQSRNMNIKLQSGDYVHMLNATLSATERTICCLLENYQTNEGVIVPEVLRKYMHGIELIKYV